jgi:Raf kinase inhibitor-like YbhB/YbcL family protein
MAPRLRFATAAALVAAAIVSMTVRPSGAAEVATAPASGVQPQPQLQLTSTAFANGGPLPRQITCLGGGLSPALQWRGAPAGARELELIVTDPDAPTGPVTHWVVYNIPVTDTAARTGRAPAGAKQGYDSLYLRAFLPPCPIPGRAHRYVFTLFAVDRQLLFTAPPTGARLRSAAAGHVLATSMLTGTFALAL